MRFTPQQTRAILDGRQTMTHVLAQASRVARRRNGTTYDTVPFVPKVDQRIPFSYDDPIASDPDHRGRAHIIVIACADTPQPVGAITAEEARAAGHKTTEDFAAWWVRQHDRDWITRREHREAEAGRDPKVFLRRVVGRRFADRHAATPVWPFRFRLDVAESDPEFLLPAARGDQGDGVLGYTHNVARALDDVEVVPTIRLDSAWSKDAEARRTEARGVEESKRALRSTMMRLRENLVALERTGADITPHLASLAAAADDLERQRTAA